MTAGLAGSTVVSADLVIFSHGGNMKISAHRTEGEWTYLRLPSGGEVATTSSAVAGIVPDEVVDEILAEVAAQPAPGRLKREELMRLSDEIARRHGLDPKLVWAVIAVESNFDERAVSPKGAQGLMQLMPRTAATLGVGDAFDPSANLDGGARYLRQLIERFRGDIDLALAAYNAGPGAVARHRGIPPIRETQAYVKKVRRRYERPAKQQ